jgi:hypothetical protein
MTLIAMSITTGEEISETSEFAKTTSAYLVVPEMEIAVLERTA